MLIFALKKLKPRQFLAAVIFTVNKKAGKEKDGDQEQKKISMGEKDM